MTGSYPPHCCIPKVYSFFLPLTKKKRNPSSPFWGSTHPLLQKELYAPSPKSNLRGKVVFPLHENPINLPLNKSTDISIVFDSIPNHSVLPTLNLLNRHKDQKCASMGSLKKREQQKQVLSLYFELSQSTQTFFFKEWSINIIQSWTILIPWTSNVSQNVQFCTMKKFI